jgi:hypothetical protein
MFPKEIPNHASKLNKSKRLSNEDSIVPMLMEVMALA